MGDQWEFAKRAYLVQHGEAKREEKDPERPLTDRGRADVTRLARFAANTGQVRVDRILHSGKTRARQTAEILAEYLRPPGGLALMDGLAPNDDPATAAAAIAQTSEALLFVGHLPHLGRLASLLLIGTPDKRPVAFRMGGLVALGMDENGAWSVAWALIPDLVPE